MVDGFVGAFDLGVSAIKGLGNIIAFDYDVLSDVFSGDIAAARGKYANVFAAIGEGYDTAKLGYERASALLGDERGRKLLYETLDILYSTSSNVDQVRLLGALPVETLLALGTGGASTVLRGAGLGAKGSKLLNTVIDNLADAADILRTASVNTVDSLFSGPVSRSPAAQLGILRVGGFVPDSVPSGWSKATSSAGEADLAQYSNLKSYYHSLDEGLHQNAASKGYSGIKVTENGNPDFSGSRYLYETSSDRNIVTIELQGSRYQDFKLANEIAGFPGAKAPSGYTWHHIDDFNSQTGTSTMQLVEQGAHKATYSHFGSVKQYEQYYGVKYK